MTKSRKKIRHLVGHFMSRYLWEGLPRDLQIIISRKWGSLFNKKFTKHLIPIYCKWSYSNKDYLKQFCSNEGDWNYSSFQDFFTRNLRKKPISKENHMWMCEGLLCQKSQFKDLKEVSIKGEKKDIKIVFGNKKIKIPNSYFYSNIFLDNTNYHRVHSPITGKITWIKRIHGILAILRPWLNWDSPSYPALRNERVSMEILDSKTNKPWYLSIVGGPGVGTISLPKQIAKGKTLFLGEEIATFYLGSTCCLASPKEPKTIEGRFVNVGMPLASKGLNKLF